MNTIRPEIADDHWAVEALYDLCFAPGRQALSSYRLRDGIAPIHQLCMVMEDELGEIGGAIRYWPVQINGHAIALLGPIAVHPIRQGEGVGAALMTASIAQTRAQGIARILLVGDLPYYKRFGFKTIRDVEMPPPTNPDRVLGLEVTPKSWRNLRGKIEKVDPNTHM